MIPFAVMDDVILGAARVFRKGNHGGPFKGQLGFFGLDVAVSGALAPRGQMLAHMTGAAGAFPAGAAAAYYGQKMATRGIFRAIGKGSAFAGKRALVSRFGPGVTRFGVGMAGNVVGIAAAIAVDQMVREPLTKAYTSVVDAGKQVRHVATGGDYVDTQAAATMRQRAVQEMSSSLLNARQWLGKESVLMHQ